MKLIWLLRGNYGWPNVAGYKDDSGYAYAKTIQPQPINLKLKI